MFLWAYGALRDRTRLLSGGLPRGYVLIDEHRSSSETVDGAFQSMFVPSVSGTRMFIFEWDETKSVKHVVDL